MRIRKQINELTAVDLESFPVWEFALEEEGNEGQDEATVRPCKATFQLADGTRLPGHLTAPREGAPSIDTIQPAIVTGNGQVVLWFGVMRTGPARRPRGAGPWKRC
jgi:hypothetical protein